MSDGLHLLLPLAAPAHEEARSLLAGMRLPATERLLATLVVTADERDSEQALSMPHERVLARECGLPLDDGRIPLAAWQVAAAGAPDGAAWGWITPCHWEVGTRDIRMHHPQDLRLDGEESQALLAAMQPFFAEDGLELRYEAPTRWLARGPLLAQVATASLDRVIGRLLDEWMPRGDGARLLRRLQQEMQMLLYTHPVNEERLRGGQLPVNSFWASGTGALPAQVAAQPAGLQVLHGLRDAALLQDWRAWAANWEQFESRDAPRLLQAAQAGHDVRLTLCGERGARTWQSTRRGPFSRLSTLWSRPRIAECVQDL
ncbi:phosphoglycerate mutase [Ramlibacter algicola]|uniref:Phosphoglycerate mutase n=1 Tax=Ramlibacter algicola TaxID=2795217 RepID=A0A934Q238_9BURK|nr:phosphoglycerate mutase [Ramlibacter algicola]MBK0394609.1 phosphoglycerate mutase [Ramlibacter algicola]